MYLVYTQNCHLNIKINKCTVPLPPENGDVIYGWPQISSSNSGRNGNNVPPERAFHSAHIMGNYMLVFGGYSHKHNEVENCYDQHIYFFHLGCHTWVSQRILEHSPQGRAYPKKQGWFFSINLD